MTVRSGAGLFKSSDCQGAVSAQHLACNAACERESQRGVRRLLRHSSQSNLRDSKGTQPRIGDCSELELSAACKLFLSAHQHRLRSIPLIRLPIRAAIFAAGREIPFLAVSASAQQPLATHHGKLKVATEGAPGGHAAVDLAVAGAAANDRRDHAAESSEGCGEAGGALGTTDVWRASLHVGTVMAATSSISTVPTAKRCANTFGVTGASCAESVVHINGVGQRAASPASRKMRHRLLHPDVPLVAQFSHRAWCAKPLPPSRQEDAKTLAGSGTTGESVVTNAFTPTRCNVADEPARAGPISGNGRGCQPGP